MTEFRLRDGSTTENRSLDRLLQFDERSREFPVREIIQNPSWRSYTWRCNPIFDQGKEGACVAYALAHELAARPAEVEGITDKWMKENVYWEAQKIDPWDGGSYPGASPVYEGTSILAGVKIVQSKGFYQSYRWSFSIDDLITGLGRVGPAVLGINWYQDMYYPDDKGYIQKSGRLGGGHAILARGVNLKTETVTLRNSWGTLWGKRGDCYIKIHELESILKENGEAVFLVGRTASPMIPYNFGKN